MKIRKAKLEDAIEIYELRSETIKKINKDYSKKQVDTYVKKHSKEIILKNIKLRDTFCLVDNDKILGVVDLVNDRIGGLFVRHDLVGKGQGRKLMDFIEDFAKKKEVKEVWLYSTPYAEEFYKKMGYKAVERGTWILEGVKFPEVRMEKKLK